MIPDNRKHYQKPLFDLIGFKNNEGFAEASTRKINESEEGLARTLNFSSNLFNSVLTDNDNNGHLLENRSDTEINDKSFFNRLESSNTSGIDKESVLNSFRKRKTINAFANFCSINSKSIFDSSITGNVKPRDIIIGNSANIDLKLNKENTKNYSSPFIVRSTAAAKMNSSNQISYNREKLGSETKTPLEIHSSRLSKLSYTDEVTNRVSNPLLSISKDKENISQLQNTNLSSNNKHKTYTPGSHERIVSNADRYVPSNKGKNLLQKFELAKLDENDIENKENSNNTNLESNGLIKSLLKESFFDSNNKGTELSNQESTFNSESILQFSNDFSANIENKFESNRRMSSSISKLMLFISN